MFLDSLYVKNFRIFKELKVQKLSRVNLFTGKNNSGKSCLLEAVQSYANKFENINELVIDRDEHWETVINLGNNIESPLRHIFYGYHLPSNEKQCIEIGSLNDKKNRISVVISLFKIIDEEEGFRVRRRLEPNQLSLLDIGENIKVGLDIIFKNEIVNFINVESDFDDYMRKRRNPRLLPNKEKESKIIVQKVSAQNNINQDISVLWDNISLTSLQKEVIRGLKIIEPNILDIALIGESKYSGKTRIPVVKYSDSEERLPLKTFGDGMNRLFNIILALVNAKGGILLLDEIENGLHWSVHSKLWEIIYRLSEKLDVQVFATTHSLDCVRSFNQIWQENQEKATFHRLEKSLKTDDIKAVYYNQELLSDTLETDVEFR